MRISELMEGWSDALGAVENIINTAVTGQVSKAKVIQSDQVTKYVTKLGNVFLNKWVDDLNQLTPAELATTDTLKDLMAKALSSFEIKNVNDDPNTIDRLLDIGDDIVKISSHYIAKGKIGRIKTNKNVRKLIQDILIVAVTGGSEDEEFRAEVIMYKGSAEHYYAMVDKPNYRKWRAIQRTPYITNQTLILGNEISSTELTSIQQQSSYVKKNITVIQDDTNKNQFMQV